MKLYIGTIFFYKNCNVLTKTKRTKNKQTISNQTYEKHIYMYRVHVCVQRLLNVYTSSEEFLEKLLRLDRTDSDRNRSSSSFVSAVPTQKTRRVLSRPVIFRLSEFRNELEGSDFEVGEDTISASKSCCREMNQSFVPSYSYFPIFCLR